jgi:hypothetical protein
VNYACSGVPGQGSKGARYRPAEARASGRWRRPGVHRLYLSDKDVVSLGTFPAHADLEAKLRRAGKGRRLVIENGAWAEANAGLAA